jgi:DNA-binding beta-propeller fold protein YncE
MKNILFLLTLLSGYLFPQDYFFDHEIGKFNGASGFSIAPTGVLYIADKETNEVYKYDTTGHELKSIGGYGWDEGAFDQPEDIFATILYVYVPDRNNHRVQIFDKDLNFISQIKGSQDNGQRQSGTEDASFGYPMGCVSSSLGDIFILDSENKQILKLNTSGQFMSRFGNYQSGDYELRSPKAMAISQDNKLLVLQEGEILVFDQYGNGIGKIRLDIQAAMINITQNNMVLNSPSKLYVYNTGEERSGIKEIMLSGYDLNDGIVEGLIYKDNLYVLTAHQIAVFKKKKAE